MRYSESGIKEVGLRQCDRRDCRSYFNNREYEYDLTHSVDREA